MGKIIDFTQLIAIIDHISLDFGMASIDQFAMLTKATDDVISCMILKYIKI
jgi:hypothetical protein